MKDAAYTLTVRHEETHWWHVARRRIVIAEARRALAATRKQHGEPPAILDYGCGSGGVLARLAELGAAYGADTHPQAVAAASARALLPVALVPRSPPHDSGNPFKDVRFDLITALDVIEHLDDDAGALRALSTWLKPGGQLLITVPAYPWLWGPEDELSDHRRRYTRRALANCVRRAGLDIARLTYVNMWLLPAQAFVIATQRLLPRHRRVLSNVGGVPAALNAALLSIFASEARLLPHFDLPAGGSLLCRAQRRLF